MRAPVSAMLPVGLAWLAVTPSLATSGAETQRITLEGINLRSALSLSNFASDSDVALKLIQQNKLLIDA